MSMTVRISATREVIVIKTGEKSTQTVYFDCWQTPAKVSFHIIERLKPLVAYKQWVLGENRVETYDVFEPDDIFEERNPIGQKTVNYSEKHVNELDVWIEDCEKGGYTIEVDLWYEEK